MAAIQIETTFEGKKRVFDIFFFRCCCCCFCCCWLLLLFRAIRMALPIDGPWYCHSHRVSPVELFSFDYNLYSNCLSFIKIRFDNFVFFSLLGPLTLDCFLSRERISKNRDYPIERFDLTLNRTFLVWIRALTWLCAMRNGRTSGWSLDRFLIFRLSSPFTFEFEEYFLTFDHIWISTLDKFLSQTLALCLSFCEFKTIGWIECTFEFYMDTLNFIDWL